MDLFDLLIHFLLRLFDILAMRNTHQHASAVGQQFILLTFGSHMKHQAVKILYPVDLCAFLISARIAIWYRHPDSRRKPSRHPP